MSKWTDWIPHTGDECPVDGDEKMKIRFEDDKSGDYVCVNQPTILNWISPCRHPRITHYKRLKKNVAAEDLDSLKDRPETRRGPCVIKDSDLADTKAEEHEMWVNLYRFDDGSLHMGPEAPATRKDLRRVGSSKLWEHIGTVLLNPEDTTQ